MILGGEENQVHNLNIFTVMDFLYKLHLVVKALT